MGIDIQQQMPAGHRSVPFHLDDAADPLVGLFLPLPLYIGGQGDPGLVQLHR